MTRSTRRLCGILLMAALLPAGCHHRAAPPPAPVTSGAQASRPGSTAPVAQANDPGAQVKRGRERQVDQNLLHQIGLFYQEYVTENGRPPTRQEDFLNYIQREGHREYQALKDGLLVLNLTPRPGSNTILCYEKEPDLNNNRLVLMTDGSVLLMRDADVQAALKAGQR